MNNYINILLIVIILIIFLINFEHSKINFHKLWNPRLYDIHYNPKFFSKNHLIKKLEQGKTLAKQKKIVICTLARNISKIFKKTKSRIEIIASYFKEYKIIIFENDSTDNSRNLIENWSKINSNVILLDCCNLGSCECKLKMKTGYEYGTFSKNRLSKMALYRQQYLNYINTNLTHYDYMMVFDFDLDGNININGLFDCLNKKDWGAIFCNGRNSVIGTFGMKTIPYDPMATLFENDNYNIKKYNYFDLYKKIEKMDYLIKKNHFIPVKSAFNGFGIYKIKSVIGCSYIDKNNLCEHVNLAKCLNNKNEKIFINSYWEGYFNMQGDNPINVFISSLFS